MHRWSAEERETARWAFEGPAVFRGAMQAVKGGAGAAHARHLLEKAPLPRRCVVTQHWYADNVRCAGISHLLSFMDDMMLNLTLSTP